MNKDQLYNFNFHFNGKYTHKGPLLIETRSQGQILFNQKSNYTPKLIIYSKKIFECLIQSESNTKYRTVKEFRTCGIKIELK